MTKTILPVSFFFGANNKIKYSSLYDELYNPFEKGNHIILKGGSLDLLREAAEYGQNFMNLSRKRKTLRILIDVEPSSVL